MTNINKPHHTGISWQPLSTTAMFLIFLRQNSVAGPTETLGKQLHMYTSVRQTSSRFKIAKKVVWWFVVVKTSKD